MTMKENDVIKDLDIIRFNPHWDELVKEEYWQEIMEMSIKALEEVQQYRALGTPEDLKAMKEHGAFTGTELAQLAAMQMRLREYEQIGTPEECLRNKDFLDFLSDKMNPNDFETYLHIYNLQDEEGDNHDGE